MPPLCCLIPVVLAVIAAESGPVVRSPDGSLGLEFTEERSARVVHGPDAVLDVPELGLLVDGAGIGPRSAVTSAEVDEPESQLFATRGARSKIRLAWTDAAIGFGDDGELDLRVYNSAIAWRYRIPVPNERERPVLREATTWELPDNASVWFAERPNLWKLRTYAGEMRRAAADRLHAVSPTGPLQGKPLTLQLDTGGYVLLTEAAQFAFPGLRFRAERGGVLRADLAPAPDEPWASEGDRAGRAMLDRAISGELVSPWRVVLVADTLDELARAGSVIQHLSPPPDADLFADGEDWIVPGRSAWAWWSDQDIRPGREREMIDAAARLGFEHTIIDDGWEAWERPWRTVEALAREGEQRGVRVWVWKHSGEVADPARDHAELRRFLERVADAGLAGVKFDFFNAEDARTTRFMERILVECARRRLMVNFHGCSVPTGWSRTFPNEMTREGVRGLELNLHPEGPITPAHDAAVVLSRFVIGHGDYTPVGYTNGASTDWAHQLAMAVLVVSPQQVIAEDPAVLLGPLASPGRDVLESIPAVWDESVVLAGSSLGGIAAIARRSGRSWFLGVVRGDVGDRDRLRLAFLDPGARYRVTELRGDTAGGFRRRETTRSADDAVRVPDVPGHGLVLRFVPLAE